ncbi:MAG: pyridoxamine 5'-phosphate oxidase family protein [Thaumarchaeota archaeon]|nr:pyridoxamine 5'-phosphate oxidase family protein [Nitrososphaerota archaeon]
MKTTIVYETDSEIEELQRLLDQSYENAGAHGRSIFKPEHRLSARQLLHYLQDVKQVAAATVNLKGEPRVAPIDSIFYHGRFYLSTEKKSLRARHVAKRPGISLTLFDNADPVIIVHGKAAFVHSDHPDFAKLDSEWVKTYGTSTTELSKTVLFIKVEPEIMLAYAFHPERFQE